LQHALVLIVDNLQSGHEIRNVA